MALRRNRRGEGEGADDRASWNAGGTWPAAEHPIGAPVSPAATAELANVPALGGPGAADPAWGDGLVDASALADMQAFNDLKAKRKKQKKRKIITAVAVVAVLAVVAGGVGFWYVSDQAARAMQEAGMQFAPVEQGTFTQTVSASGNLRPVASVSATPEVDGIVGEVLVSEGDTVAAGQTLFTVVNAELDKAVTQAAQGIEEARNGVAQAQNAVNDAYRAKEQGRQAAADAQAAAAAMAAAGGEGGAGAAAAGGQSFDEAGADSAIRQAELSLNSANLGLQNAQAAYDEAVARAEKRTVTSSIAGSVVAVNIEPGKALGATASGAGTGSPVQIADLSQMKVSIGVNEIDILKVSADQQATVTFTAAPDLQLPAKVVRIATTSSGSGDGAAAGAYGGSGAAVTYAVELLIETPDPRLKPGMTAKATIVTQTIERALMVPISAVQTDGAGGGYVMVLVDPETQETEMRKVETVASDGLTTVVKGDIKPGDSVVVGGGALGGMDASLAGGGAVSDSGAVVSGDSVVVG